MTHRLRIPGTLIVFALLYSVSIPKASASDLDEFKVKREQIFAFAQKPMVIRDGDVATITFESKGFCDVTVAIENAAGRIVRHLASGVLGPNPPAPFKKNSKKQTLIWDGKDDQGNYIDNKGAHSVRVSLGLKPRLERTLFWSPHKRTAFNPLIAASPEGVFVYQGKGVDSVCQFDHKGDYLKTVYPFPNQKLRSVEGLRWHKFPQGYERPLKEGHYENTLLTSGSPGMTGKSAMGMAVRGPRVALAFEFLNRLGVEGSSGGLPLKGPKTMMKIKHRGLKEKKAKLGPSSMAFSPDGKTLYMTGYLYAPAIWGSAGGSLQAVLKMNYEKNDEPSVFVGKRDTEGYGKGNDQFTMPTSVACDAQGRVYVSDFMNDRVQVFSEQGKHLHTIPVKRPAKVLVHQRTGEIYVFSWTAFGVPLVLAKQLVKKNKGKRVTVAPRLTTFSKMPNPKQLESGAFPLGPGDTSGTWRKGAVYQVALDSWAESPTFWIAGRKPLVTKQDEILLANMASKNSPDSWNNEGIRLLAKKKGKWEVIREFGQDAAKAIVRTSPGRWNVQKPMVNPSNGKLYLGEGLSEGLSKGYNELLEIDPATGKYRLLKLPIDALDMAFDQNGHAYVRKTDLVVRYDSETWREIPWDYGETCEILSTVTRTKVKINSALIMPSRSPVCHQQGGISVSPKGHVVVACHDRSNSFAKNHRIARPAKQVYRGKEYNPPLFPGRESSSTSSCIHVWDKHGKLVYEDAIPGIPQIDGVFMDKDDSLYVMATPTRILDGKKYFNPVSETLMKFKPKKGKIVSTKNSPLPLQKTEWPDRKQDLNGRWVTGAEWFYGGVGFAGFNGYLASFPCACWWSRFSLDYFARSFAPEPYQYSVAVLDSNGNLILRVGRPGNVDDGKPLTAAGGPGNTRSIGGDEVAIFHSDFVGTDTDKRLFIADLGNGCIRSVKLGYHAEEKIFLKDVPDKAAK